MLWRMKPTQYTNRLAIVVTERLRADVERAANAREVSVSQFIRDTLRAQLAAERLREREAAPDTGKA